MDYLEEARRWLGREQHVEDVLAAGPARGLTALLDRDDAWIRPGAPLPPLWHWLYLQQFAPRSRVGPDGHERLGEFLPPLPFPRRRWAGGRVRFLADLPLGAAAARTSTVSAVEEKRGRTGPFALVTVRHRISVDGELAVEEEQDLVYLPAPTPAQATSSGDAPAPGQATSPAAEATSTTGPGGSEPVTWTRVFEPTPGFLFRFSALTLNGHRIHWDRQYATEVEGYPDLVVHAPLLALLLLDGAVAQAARAPGSFSYRALAPTFAGQAIRLEGGAAAVRALAPDGRIALSGWLDWS